jgi:hypothetical protein
LEFGRIRQNTKGKTPKVFYLRCFAGPGYRSNLFCLPEQAKKDFHSIPCAFQGNKMLYTKK